MPSDSDGGAERVNPFELFVRDPEATYFLRAAADDPGLDVRAADILVVDRGAPALDGKRVVANVDGELRIMRLERRGGASRLRSDAGDVDITGREHAFIWGVVTWTLREG